MEYIIYGWLGALILFLVIEIATTSLTTIWFAGGTVVALILNLCKAPFAAQAVSFFVISLALLILARPVLDKAMKKNHVKTNIDSLIGEKAKVTEKINNIDETGAVFINGLTWTARSKDSNKIIEPGEVVEIKAVSGVKSTVSAGAVTTIIVAIVLLIIIASCIRIVPQAHAVILERLGAYKRTWGVGIHLKAPFIDRPTARMSLKEQVVDFAPQPVITKDNVTMRIDTVVFFQITDPKLYAYGVEHPIMAIENLTATTLRNIIGELELDQTLTSREIINTKMRLALDTATDPWGIKVNRVELKNIIPPAEIQNAMEKQMKAERERREMETRAEGEKKANITVAEGKKQSAILEAEAEKQSAILRAEAKKEATIREAEGQAEAIRAVQMANAEGIKYIREAGADEAVITLKSLEAFAKAADGKATKIIIPSEIQSIAGLVKSVVEIGKNEETK